MATNDELIKEAAKLGGQVMTMTGQLFAKRQVKGVKGQFYVIALNFYSSDDFMVLAKQIEKLGLQGFTEADIKPMVQQGIDGVSPDIQIPKCKFHGSPMKPGKKPGTFFCPRKLHDGTYCTEEKNV